MTNTWLCLAHGLTNRSDFIFRKKAVLGWLHEMLSGSGTQKVSCKKEGFRIAAIILISAENKFCQNNCR
jgi:hypothetical protein